MGIEVTEDGKMINTCDWPDCGCREEVEWRFDKGWNCFTGDEELGEAIGLPNQEEVYVMLCIHHQEAIEAFEDGDMERFRLLASL